MLDADVGGWVMWRLETVELVVEVGQQVVIFRIRPSSPITLAKRDGRSLFRKERISSGAPMVPSPKNPATRRILVSQPVS